MLGRSIPSDKAVVGTAVVVVTSTVVDVLGGADEVAMG
jgi:hypothetical protein